MQRHVSFTNPEAPTYVGRREFQIYFAVQNSAGVINHQPAQSIDRIKMQDHHHHHHHHHHQHHHVRQ